MGALFFLHTLGARGRLLVALPRVGVKFTAPGLLGRKFWVAKAYNGGNCGCGGGVLSIYVVKSGDSVAAIAAKNNLTEEELIYANELVYPYRLAVGQALWVPQGVYAGFGRGIWANGYAYPFIDGNVLGDTLPYLSSVSVFSYGFEADGELLPPEPWDDEPLIAAVLAAGVRPVLTITPFGADGAFNNLLISEMLANPAARALLNAGLLATVRQKGYAGVNVDFEYILPEDRDSFSAWVAELADVLHGAGYEVSVAVAPKLSAEQEGLLYQGQDWAALGQVADYVLVMTYEWGYTYSAPQPIAPLNWVRRVVEYAVTEIPPAKIDLGIANYAYDWPLPYVAGETRADSFGVLEAARLAADVGAEILWDEAAASPYYNYEREGVAHEVWFEDVRSLGGKLALINEFGLHGGGWWQIMRPNRPGWLSLAAAFAINR